MDELKVRVAHENPHIIGITETWLTPNIQDMDIKIHGYNFIRKDRCNGKRGGGVLLFYRFDVAVMTLPGHCASEVLWCKVSSESSRPLVVGLFYRSPNEPTIDADVITQFRRYPASPLYDTLIFGDFNAPHVDWRNYSCPDSFRFDRWLLSTSEDLLLKQHVLLPTRFGDCSSSVLDLVFTSDFDNVIDFKNHAPLGSSDHAVLSWTILFSAQIKSSPPQPRPDYNRAKIPEMLEYISRNLDYSALHALNTEDVLGVITSSLQNSIANFVPLRRSKQGHKLPPWSTSEITLAVNQKKRKHKLLKKCHCELHRNQFKMARKHLNDLLKTERSAYETRLVSKFPENPKAFYRYIRGNRSSKDSISCLRSKDGAEHFEDSMKADILALQFDQNFVKDGSSGDPPFSPKMILPPEASDVQFTETEVLRELKNLKLGSSSGPDNLPASMLSSLADVLAPALAILFRKSFLSGKLPSTWKLANICPIFKNGSKLDPANYRPISLTSIVCKVMERIIKKHAYEYIEKFEILSSAQHGFRAKRSCLTNLLTALEEWTDSLDHGVDVDVIYFDLQKAFDTVPHHHLILKLEGYGIRGPLLKWLEDFVTSRFQRVCVGSAYSPWYGVRSGVPQGSVLGPLLFILYINDISSHLQCHHTIFADDLKIWRSIRSPEDKCVLDEDLIQLQCWSQTWMLQFNRSKSSVLHLGSCLPPRQYFLNSSALTTSQDQRDLGVIISSSLKFSSHCVNVTNRALRLLFSIRRSFLFINVDSFRVIYNQFVRPLIEYCIQACRPLHKKDLLLLESVQRRATKMVVGLCKTPYDQRLLILNLFPVSYRFDRGDLIFTYKLLHGFVNLDPYLFFYPSQTRFLRGNSHKLFKRRYRTSLRGNFYSNRVISLWNSLPSQITLSESVDVFKSRLDAFFVIVNRAT
jgi:hypothetical protein